MRHIQRLQLHIANRKAGFRFVLMCLMLSLCLQGCGEAQEEVLGTSVSYEDVAEDATLVRGSRDNTIRVLTPVASGEEVLQCDVAQIDVSNAQEGYIAVNYFGDCAKVKLQITGPDQVTYSYNLQTGKEEFFPLSAGSGMYTLGVYENVAETQYAIALSQEVEVNITNQFGPNLYPNQYSMFTEETKFVKKSADLSYSMNDDLSFVTNVFNYVLCTMSYDVEKAENIAKGYVCDLDEIYETRTGVCLDYAAIMTCILRSQGIPTMLQVGYAGTAYHAWISTYIEEKGWINGIIEFDGENWSLMDPTLADSTATDKLKDFIGDGSNYLVKYVY